MPPLAAKRGGSDGKGVGGEGSGRSVPGDSEEAQPALISTSGKVEVPQVLTGDSLGLVSFEIFSHSTQPVEVSLSSSLDQVTFQLSNGNLDARAPDLYHDEEEGDEEWDGMLNEVGCVQSVRVEPMQSTTVVVCVCPSRVGGLAGSASEGRSRRDDFEFEELGPGFGAPQHSHSISELRGTIHLRAREMAGAHTTPAGGAAAAAAQGGADVAAAARSQHLAVELVGRSCRSVLRVDAQELVFEKCVVGSSSVKDFTIWNCSEAHR